METDPAPLSPKHGAAHRPRPQLSDREKQILRLICDGLTDAQIASFLRISAETVRAELEKIFREIDGADGVGNPHAAACIEAEPGPLPRTISGSAAV